jgi:mRNA-degrading endonuclease toxin of MazEF toxin-antitoxin module
LTLAVTTTSSHQEPKRNNVMSVMGGTFRTVAKHRLAKRLGALSAQELDAVERVIAIQLGLRHEP